MTVQSATLPQQQTGALRALWLTALTMALVIAQALMAQARPDSFSDLVDKVSPAVVNITTSTTVAVSTGPGPQLPEGSPFEDFFRDWTFLCVW